MEGAKHIDFRDASLKSFINIPLMFLSNAVVVSGAIFLISAFSLGAALVAQYVFGMMPCPLCLLQRIPYGAAELAGLAAFFLSYNGIKRGVPLLLFLCSASFFINAGLAFYHNGVEQHWWQSAFEGCGVPIDPTNAKTIMEKIQAFAPARCDEIPWVDPVLHLSMAAWNIMVCLSLGILSFIASVLIRRRSHAIAKHS